MTLLLQLNLGFAWGAYTPAAVAPPIAWTMAGRIVDWTQETRLPDFTMPDRLSDWTEPKRNEE